MVIPVPSIVLTICRSVGFALYVASALAKTNVQNGNAIHLIHIFFLDSSIILISLRWKTIILYKY